MILGDKFTWKEGDLTFYPPLIVPSKLRPRGVTGTQRPPRGSGKVVEEWLSTLDRTKDFIVCGVCIGIDEIVGRRAHERGFQVFGVVPWNRSRVARDFKTWCTGWQEMPEGTDYMDRNDELVKQVETLTAFPRESVEQLRSGTWATVRRGWKKGIPVDIWSLEHLIT